RAFFINSVRCAVRLAGSRSLAMRASSGAARCSTSERATMSLFTTAATRSTSSADAAGASDMANSTIPRFIHVSERTNTRRAPCVDSRLGDPSALRLSGDRLQRLVVHLYCGLLAQRLQVLRLRLTAPLVEQPLLHLPANLRELLLSRRLLLQHAEEVEPV